LLKLKGVKVVLRWCCQQVPDDAGKIGREIFWVFIKFSSSSSLLVLMLLHVLRQEYTTRGHSP